MKRMVLSSSIATLVAASTAFAHPGHGASAANTLTHYVAEPEHIAIALLAVVAVTGLARALRRGRR